MEYIFFISFFLIVYTYIVFPGILYVINTRFAADSNIIEKDNNSFFPNVSVVIAAYNEEENIKDRIDNLLNLNYPNNKIKIYIGSDGSDDRTNDIVNKICDPAIVFFPFSERRGKASVLNDLVNKAEGEIIVLSDANTEFQANAVNILVESFSDTSVGGVCGELKILSRKNNDNLDSMYWRYERFIKMNEGKMNAILGANGAIYAIKKELFQAIPADTITDDFHIGMTIVKQGYKFIYQPDAIAFEYEPENHTDEFRRRVRIGMGNYQAFSRFTSFLNPFFNFKYFFTYTSHKVLRWFTPHLMVLMLLTSIILMYKPLFMLMLIVQIATYLFCWYVYRNISIKSLPKVFSLLVFFVSMNTALLVGSLKFLTQKANPAWQRTAR